MKYKKLSKEFYLQPCLKAAKELIGKILVRVKDKNVYSGKIVETEAYLGSRDEASHSFKGLTQRNKFMFSSGGIAYVYFTYGNHYCVNAVIGKEGTADAVLIRAVEPLMGIEDMKLNRGVNDIFNLCSGPGKLTSAMKIDKNLNGENLSGNNLFIAEPESIEKPIVKRTKRIGITKNPDVLYRFIEKGSMYISRSKFN